MTRLPVQGPPTLDAFDMELARMLGRDPSKGQVVQPPAPGPMGPPAPERQRGPAYQPVSVQPDGFDVAAAQAVQQRPQATQATQAPFAQRPVQGIQGPYAPPEQRMPEQGIVHGPTPQGMTPEQEWWYRYGNVPPNTLTPPMPGPRGLEGFGQNVGSTLLSLTPTLGQRIGETKTEASFQQRGEGVGGFMGDVVGSVLPSAAAAFFPPAAGPVLAAFAGSSAEQKLKETGSVPSAIGTGALEAGTELIGLGAAMRFGARGVRNAMRMVFKGDTGKAAKVLADAGILTAADGGEEALNVIGENALDASLGLQTWEQAAENVKRDAPMAFASGAAGALLLGVAAAGGQSMGGRPTAPAEAAGPAAAPRPAAPPAAEPSRPGPVAAQPVPAATTPQTPPTTEPPAPARPPATAPVVQASVTPPVVAASKTQSPRQATNQRTVQDVAPQSSQEVSAVARDVPEASRTVSESARQVESSPSEPPAKPTQAAGAVKMGSRELDKAVADGSVKAWQITRQQAVEHIARTTKGTPTHLGGPVSQETVERAHRLSVAQAFSEGKPVPPEVLADYPELQQKGPASAQTVLETEGEVRPVAGGEDVRRGGEVEGGAVAAREGAAAQVGRHPNITHNTGAERLYNNLVDRVGVQQANKLVDNAVATYKDLTAGKIKAHKGDVGISQTRLARAIVDEYGLDPSRVRAISKSLQVPKEVPYAKGQTQQREGQDVPLQQQGQGGGEARATAAEEDVAPPSREVGSDAPASAQVEAERPSLVDGYEVDEFRIPKRAIKSEGAPLGFLTKSDADSYLSKSKKAARKNWEAVHSGSRWWIVPRSAKQESPDPATLSYAALRQRAKDLGLSPVGSKAVLVERVRGATGQGQTVPPEPTGPRIESPRPVSPSPTTPTEQIPSAQSTASEPRTPVSAPSEPPGKGRPAPAPESAGKAKEATEREDVETPQSREAQLQNAVKSYRDGETVPLQEWLQDHSAEYQRKSDRIAKLESSGDSKNRSEIDSLIADLEAIELDVVERFSPPGELQPPPPQGTMIPRKGKGRAGGVAGLDRVAHEIAALTIRAAGRVRSSVSGAATGARYYFQRGTTFIQRYGDAGRKIARDLRTIAFESHRKAQSDLQDIRELLKGVSRENVEKVMKAADGKTEGLPKWIEERGERVRAILGRVMSNFAEVGGLRTVAGNKVVPHGSGKAFPQVANAEGKRTLDELAEMGEKSSRVMAAAEYMVEQGQAESITDAIAMLHRFRERQLRGINPYLEKERVELPPNLREWNPDKVLPHTLDRGWKLVEAIRIWGWDDLGKSFPHAVELIETIRSEAAAPHAYDAARDIEAFIKAEFGAGDEAPSWQQAISQSVNAWQTVSKLGLSPLSTVKNGLDRYAKGLTVATIPSNFKATLMYPPIISTWLRSARQIEDQVLRRGAIFSTTTLSEGVEKGGAITHLVMAPFRAAETGNQVYLALVKSIQVQKDLAALADIDKSGKVKNFLRKWMSLGQYGEAAIKDRLTRMGVVDISDINVEGIVQRAIAERKGLTEDELAGVMHRATRDLAFPVMLSTKRIWWDNAPFVRVLAKFKTWGVDQIGHIHADVYRQVLKGNYAPAGRFLLAMVFAGELYNLLRDLLFGDDESLTMSIAKRPDRMNAKGIAKRIAADFFDGGGVGIIADLTYGLVDFIGGPTAGTAKTLMKETLPDIARRPSQAPTAIREFFRSEIAASRQADAVINAVDRKVGNRLNRSREYYRWRKRAFEWMDESGKRTEGETDFITRGLFGIAEVFEGRQTFDRTSRSLAYEMAARQITVGDVEDAANYLRIVLKDAKNDDDRASILSGMKGSMRSRSPLGRVAQKDRDKFLSKFSPQDRAEAIRVQDEWIADYEKAIRLAQSEP